MPASMFSYNVQRPYPYTWFTPVALVGGIMLAVLFSVMNFVNNSYILEIQDRSHPNDTIAHGAWFSNWPSYLTRSVQPICQPQELFINTQFFTNQTGFEYTLLRGAYYNSQHIDAAPSISYFNNVLETCEVLWIQAHFSNNEAFTPLRNASWGGTMRAFVQCNFTGEAGKNSMLISATYDPFAQYWSPGMSNLIATHPKKNPSLFWAEVLLNGFWKESMANLSELALGSPDPIVSCDVALAPSGISDNITSLDFFEMNFSFLTKNGKLIGGPNETDLPVLKLDPFSAIMKNFEGLDTYISPKSNLNGTWIAMDLLAKSMYSAVMTDLGQAHALQQSNLLTNETVIENLLSQIMSVERADAFAGLLFYPHFSWSHEEAAANLHGNAIHFTPSVVSTSYRCQVPRRKSGGQIFISILLADLVLLSAAWHLFTFGVGRLALDRVPRAHHCKGCLKPRKDACAEVSYLPKVAGVSTLSVVGSRRSSSVLRHDTEEQDRLSLDNRDANSS